MSCDNVYISDLPEQVDENLIRQVFSAYGTVASCKAMQSKFPGQKGAALVRFGSPEEAQWVVDNLNGNIAEGLTEPVRMKLANAKGSGKGGAGGGSFGKMSAPTMGAHAQSAPYAGGDGGSSEPSDNVYFADLPENVDEQLVRTVFGSYGSVMACKAMPSKAPGQKGAALVRFGSADEAAWVVQNLNGNIAEGLEAPIKVRFANARGSGKGGGAGGNFGGGAAPQMMVGGKGQGKPGSSSQSDIHQVLKGLAKSLPGFGKKPEENSLYIAGLPQNTTDLELYRLFAPYGSIPCHGVTAKVGGNGACTGVAFVDFNDAASANTAAESLNGLILPDQTTLTVRIKRAKGQVGQGPQLDQAQQQMF